MNNAPSYSIVIPCYNEALHIGVLLKYVEKAFAGVDHETIVIADGCTDGSTENIRAMTGSHPAIRLVTNVERLGKGGAIRRGVLEARGHAVGFIDGDGEIDPTLLLRAFEKRQELAADMIIGDRYAPGAGYHTTAFRHLTSRCYQFLILMLFGLRFRDTQAGLKVFSADVAAKLFRASHVDGYAFDIDILTHAHWLGFSIATMPMTQRFKGTSSITWRHILEMIADTFGIFDRHVRFIATRWRRHESSTTPILLWAFLLYPFTTIAETILRMIIGKGK